MSKEKVRKIIDDSPYAVLATSVNGQPRVRPMKFVITDDFKFWCSTVNVSGKVGEFKKNGKVEICWVDSEKNQVRVEGLLDFSGDTGKKRKLFELHPGMKGLFKDEYDPRLVHVEVVPTNVRWKERGFCEYHKVKL